MAEPFDTALSVIEEEAKELRNLSQSGRAVGFEDIKILLKALGIMAGQKEIQEGARVYSAWWPVFLKGFAEEMKKI